MLSVNDLKEAIPVDVGMEVAEGLIFPLSCKQVLRFLPDKRLVCSAQWQGNAVIAKIFTGWRGRRDYAVEKRGTQRLKDRGILTPEIRCSGRIPDHDGLVLLYEEIEKSRTLQDAWDEDMDVERRDSLMRRAVSVLALHHERGVIQSDLHLNNFLIINGDIYTIDTSHVTVYPGPVPMRRAIDNLAMLLSQMYVEEPTVHCNLFDEYGRCRGFTSSKRQSDRFLRAIRRGRRRLKKNLHNKIYRDCTAYSYRRIKGGRMLCRREYLTSGLRDYLENIDEKFEEACKQYLKQGRSSTVCRIDIDEVRLVVKRYNVKSLLSNFRRSMRASRASRTWSNAHNLLFYSIETARPVALIERRSWFMPAVSYFVSESVDGDNAWDYFNKVGSASSEAVVVAEQIVSIIRRLGNLSIGHGDMKATNFIITKDGPYLMDLDALVQYHSRICALRAHRADIKRFLENWDDMPSVRGLFEALENW